MTVSDRIVDNDVYDAIANREDFELLDIHTSHVRSGTCADLGRSANDLLYVRAYTSHADSHERERAYLYSHMKPDAPRFIFRQSGTPTSRGNTASKSWLRGWMPSSGAWSTQALRVKR